MAVARPHHNCMKKSALSLHAHLGGRRTDLSRIHGRTRPGGRVLLRLSETRPSCLGGSTTTDGKCPTFSEVASFSSSLKNSMCLWILFDSLFLLAGFKRIRLYQKFSLSSSTIWQAFHFRHILCNPTSPCGLIREAQG